MVEDGSKFNRLSSIYRIICTLLCRSVKS